MDYRLKRTYCWGYSGTLTDNFIYSFLSLINKLDSRLLIKAVFLLKIDKEK